MIDEKALLDDGTTIQIPGEYGHPIPRELVFRELGFNGPFSRHSVGKAIVSATLKTKAVHTMSTKNVLQKKNFKLPTGARTTFHLAFSPDGTKVASCHGDHNVYVSNITTMEVEHTLSGHPRTPWCVVFHPTQNDILASGCLAGHVRVWDLNGGSELLVCDSGTVIASLSFHPTVRLLAIATFNEIVFWDWALGAFPLARTSTGNVKEKVRLIRFDRLGHNLVTGITNFPNPPVGGAGSVGETGSDVNPVPPPPPVRNRSAFFRPNILSRTPQPTHATQSLRRPFTPSPTVSPTLELDDDPTTPPPPPLPVSVLPTVTDLNERQERFQESYRQLVHHYEGLVQHYQHFIRTRLGVQEAPSPQPSVIEYFPASDPEESSSAAEQSNDAPPIDIIVTENPSHNLQEFSVAVLPDEVPGPSTRIFQSSSAQLIEHPSTSRGTGRDGERPRNNNDLRSIQTLEQNILEMQNLCMRARRDSSNFPVEPIHIQELRTIRRHLEVLQDQTRRLQSSIRHTLSSLANGTGGLDALRGRLTSFIPTVSNSVPPTATTIATAVSTIEDNIVPMETPQDQDGQPNTVEDIIGRTIQNALRAQPRLAPGHGRPPPSIPNPMEFDNPTVSVAAGGSAARDDEPPQMPERPPHRFVQRYPREFFTDTVHEHSRYCPYGDGGGSRPQTRMRCISDLGQEPMLSVWPTVETGHERSVRSFRLSEDDNRTNDGASTSRNQVAISTNTTDRNNNSDPSFPSFGNWMGEGPGWINNDLGVRVYLTVRQFNERINSLRNERDQLLAERDDLLVRRARATTQLARARLAARTRECDGPENWQRNFNSGVALVPSNVREGSRNYHPRRGRSETVTSNLGTSTSTTPAQTERIRLITHQAPQRLAGNFIRINTIRVGDDAVPVYGQRSEREVPQQNVFVFPVGLFLEGSGWSHSSIAIYWPHSSREEEESMTEYRRSENLIPVFTREAERVLDERYPRFSLEYDSTRLVLRLGQGLSLIFIQPGLPLLDATTTMAHFPRPRENSGIVYMNHVTPFLDAVQRLLGCRRRIAQGSGNYQPPTHTLRFSTVLQPGPYAVGRGVHYSLRTRPVRRTEDGNNSTGVPSRGVQTEGGGDGAENGVPIHHHVNVRLRRDLLRDWERSLSLYRTVTHGLRPSVRQSGNTAAEPDPERSTWDDFDPRLQPSPDWPSFLDGPTTSRQADAADYTNPTESASLASTRRVIRLAVATAASNVLRRPHVLTSYAAPTINSFATAASRAVESRIERVLNERGNRGDMDSLGNSGNENGDINELGDVPPASWLPPIQRQRRNTPMSHPSDRAAGSTTVDLSVTSRRRDQGHPQDHSAPFQFHWSQPIRFLTSEPSSLQDRQPAQNNGTGAVVRTAVTSARPLRRLWTQMTPGVESGDSDSDDGDGLSARRARMRREPRSEGYQVPGSQSASRRRGLRSPEPGFRRTTDPASLERPLFQEVRRLGRGPMTISTPLATVEVPAPSTQPREQFGIRIPGSGDNPFFMRRAPNQMSEDVADHQVPPPRRVYYRSRRVAREFRDALGSMGPAGSQNPPPLQPEEIPMGARFYPGYIPEIVITPRARPPNYYTLDASTTAFLSSRIQKWDFSSFEIPKLELREEGVVVHECSLHSDACLDLSNDGDFMAVCIPSDSGSYSAIGIYSIRDESLGDVIHMFHFEQNTVSVSIAPSSDYLVVGYAGRGGPLYRFVQHTRAIGQILSLTRDADGSAKLVSVKELFTNDSHSTLMSVNCMHWVPVAGYGIIYGTNTGELVLLT